MKDLDQIIAMAVDEAKPEEIQCQKIRGEIFREIYEPAYHLTRSIARENQMLKEALAKALLIAAKNSSNRKD